MAETGKDNRPKKKVYMTRVIAAVSILAIVISSVAFLQYYLCIPPTTDVTRMVQFGKEPENSIDVLLIGSSPAYAGFSSAYAYDRFGFTSYPLVVAGSSCTTWKPVVKKALLTQKPKAIVVDVFGGGYDPEGIRSRKYQLYLVSNYTPMSAEKIRTAHEMSARADGGDTLSYVFPFIKYHTRVPANLLKFRKRLAVENYGPSPLKGIETMPRAKAYEPLGKKYFSNDKIPLDRDTRDIITDFIDYCRSEDIDLLFVKYPSMMLFDKDVGTNHRMNSVLELAESRGCRVLDLQNRFYEIGLDEKTDFYNRSHVNVRGQRKISEYLGNYIQSEMGIGPSDLDAPLREEWDRAAADYDTLCGMAEEMISSGRPKRLEDSPDVLRMVEDRRNGN